jgi:hypothetical protein
MKTRFPSLKTFALILSATVFLAHPVHAQGWVELITNGGFETGDLTGWSSPVPNPNPWSASAVLAHTGNYSAFNPALNTAVGQTTLYQLFSPTPVSSITNAGFWYYHPAGAPGTVGLATQLVFSDGTTVQDTLYATDPTYHMNAWAYRNLLPTLSTHTGLQLVGIGFFPKVLGSQFLDDVSIVGIPEDVPEPRAAILGCLGLLSIGCAFCVNKVRPTR